MHLNRLLIRVANAGLVGGHQSGTRTCLKLLTMLYQEIPIEIGHRASTFPKSDIGLVLARSAIVTHSLNVGTAGNIRLASETATTRE